jgi:alcohol dehydrogenase
MDALSQLIESYISVKASEVTDFIAWEGIKTIKQGLFKVMEDPGDIYARSLMAYGALSSGVTLANAGLGLVHGLAGPIGGFYYIPHGIVCGTLLAACCKKIIDKLIDTDPTSGAIKKFVYLGQLLSEEIGKDDNYYLSSCVAILEEWTKKLHIPRLGNFDITANDIDKIISNAGHKNTPVKLSKEELKNILLSRI